MREPSNEIPTLPLTAVPVPISNLHQSTLPELVVSIPSPLQPDEPPTPADPVNPFDHPEFLSSFPPWIRQMFRIHHFPSLRFHPLLWNHQVAFFCGGYHYRYGTIYVTVKSALWQLAEYGGTAPSTLTSSSPTRSRLSAILSVLYYIQGVRQAYNVPNPSQISIVCDDEAVLNRVERIVTNGKVPATSNHYDLYSHILSLYKSLGINDCTFYAATITKNNQGLEGEPKYIMYHLRKKAATLHHDMLRPLQPPALSETSPVTFSIAGDSVHDKHDFLTHCACTSPALSAYLCHKYNWTSSLPNSIDWHPHGRALINLTYESRVRLTKFIYDWLPTNVHQHRIDPSIPEHCIGCGELETASHILWCPTREVLREEIKDDIETFLKGSNPEISKLILAGLFEWSNPENIPPISPDTPKRFRPAALAQTKLGWNQLWYGRLCTQWGDLVSADRIKRGKGLHPDVWAQFLNRRIWRGVEKLWDARNKAQHKADEEDPSTTSRLKAQIKALYLAAQALPAADQLPFSVPIADILQLSRTQQQHWIEIHAQYISTQTKQAAIRAKKGVQDIRNFFTRKPPPSVHSSPDDKPP